MYIIYIYHFFSCVADLGFHGCVLGILQSARVYYVFAIYIACTFLHVGDLDIHVQPYRHFKQALH